jgi:hypothetical protein
MLDQVDSRHSYDKLRQVSTTCFGIESEGTGAYVSHLVVAKNVVNCAMLLLGNSQMRVTCDITPQVVEKGRPEPMGVVLGVLGSREHKLQANLKFTISQEYYTNNDRFA